LGRIYIVGRTSVDASLPVDFATLEWIWRAWREGRLEERLQSAAIATGAVYLVAELSYIDRLRRLARERPD